MSKKIYNLPAILSEMPQKNVESRVKIIFFGTPSFAAGILEFLYDHGLNIVAVVTQPDRPKGRGQQLSPTPVKALSLAKRPEIPVFQPEKASSDAFVQELKAFSPDLFIVAAYGEIMKSNLLELPQKTCINVHPSILPKYRGATPIQAALMHGDRETGVTIMKMVLKMDAGDIYKIVKTQVPPEMTFGELEEKLCQLSGPALLEVIKQIENSAERSTPQKEEEATYVSKISVESRIIDWKKGGEELHNQIRALSPIPSAFCLVIVGGQEKRLLIKKSQYLPDIHGQPGKTLVYEKNQWIVGCGIGAISLLEVQLEGKKNLPISDFIRGVPAPPKIQV